MTKSLLITLCFNVVLMCSAEAQVATAAQGEDPFASGPAMVAQMPNLSRWTVDYVYSNAPKKGDVSILDQYKKAALTDPSLAKALEDPQYVFSVQNIRPIHNLITQTGIIVHKETIFEQNYTGESWYMGDLLAERKPSAPKLIVASTASQGWQPFPGLSWVSRSNYTGIETEDGRKCLTFQQQVNPGQILYPWLPPEGDTVLATVHVDIKTRYPVSFHFGVETRKYVVLPPPTQALEVPDDFSVAWKAMTARIKQATPHLSPP